MNLKHLKVRRKGTPVP